MGLYRRLRTVNPAPFGAYLDFDGITVASASPERFLKLDEVRRVETRPIKGTRPRGVGPEHDFALGVALTESTKDRAENLMIVDLLRNDLSSVCAAGTVRPRETVARVDSCWLAVSRRARRLCSSRYRVLGPGDSDGREL